MMERSDIPSEVVPNKKLTHYLMFPFKCIKFLWLLFFLFPVVKEPRWQLRAINGLLFGFVFFSPVLFLLPGMRGKIDNKVIPKFEQLGVVDGKLIEPPYGNYKSKCDRYVNVKTEYGKERFFKFYSECISSDVWNSYVGSNVKIWYWKDYILQMEINGRFPDKYFYYALGRYKLTLYSEEVLSVFFVMIISCFVFFYLVYKNYSNKVIKYSSYWK